MRAQEERQGRVLGDNEFFQTGRNGGATSLAPVDVPALGDAIQLSAGSAHTCAVKASGRIACWGQNLYGQLGNGPPSNLLDEPQSLPVMVQKVDDAAEVAAGEGHSCARRKTGAVACWGRNDRGQLGAGVESNWITRVPVRDLTDAIALSAGRSHVCAARSSGAVACWGANDGGQLGDGTTAMQKLPVSVRELQGARDVAAGGAHTCAQRVDGVTVCWGADDHGQLGDGTVPFEPRPRAVVGL